MSTVTSATDAADRTAVYAAERSLPQMDRCLGMTDGQAEKLLARHVGQPVYLIRGHANCRPGKLTGEWAALKSGGTVPVVYASAGYPLSAHEVAHEGAHLVTDRDGIHLGHGPEFRHSYLALCSPTLRTRLAERFARQGLAQ
jgi:hypothetical protein